MYVVCSSNMYAVCTTSTLDTTSTLFGYIGFIVLLNEFDRNNRYNGIVGRAGYPWSLQKRSIWYSKIRIKTAMRRSKSIHGFIASNQQYEIEIEQNFHFFRKSLEIMHYFAYKKLL